MIERLRRLLPTPEALRANRWLRWIGPALGHPRLWHMSRRGIALGVALGIFFGLLVPIAQIPLAAAAAVVLRANLPSAVASTLVTNPVTFGPVYYAAWRVGGAILGQPAHAAPPVMPAEAEAAPRDENWFVHAWRRIAGVGKPLLLGLVIFACAAGLLSYLLVSGFWHLKVRWQRRRRRRRPGPAT
ncbi:MAG: DUF2062 domain-containing protein [Piscinibacter sp.]|nr:DUF2062 domain-containing protein [Piscinibacter sp.]